MWSWSIYDWANSAFATTVLAGFFPVFFRSTYSRGQPAVVVTSRLGNASSIAILTVLLVAPVLGAIADRGGWRKRALAGATLLGASSTALLAFIAPGQWFVAAAVFAAANVGFSLSNVFSGTSAADCSSL
jgi:UMF1 family MFS transporter